MTTNGNHTHLPGSPDLTLCRRPQYQLRVSGKGKADWNIDENRCVMRAGAQALKEGVRWMKRRMRRVATGYYVVEEFHKGRWEWVLNMQSPRQAILRLP